jgi:hypothetical protein
VPVENRRYEDLLRNLSGMWSSAMSYAETLTINTHGKVVNGSIVMYCDL